MSRTISKAESELEQMLQAKGFRTAVLKEGVKAPSLQGKRHFTIIPDILAMDDSGKGWCFEAKSEKESRTPMQHLRMPGGYTGPVWFLEKYKAESYLQFSRAFSCPCVIAVQGRIQWRAGFFTKMDPGSKKIWYNADLVATGWKDPLGLPVLFNVMYPLEKLLSDFKAIRRGFWIDDSTSS